LDESFTKPTIDALNRNMIAMETEENDPLASA